MHAQAHFYAKIDKLLQCTRRQVLRKRGQDARFAFHQNDARLRRVDVTKILRQRVACNLRDRARHLHTGRTAADNDKRHSSFTRCFVADFLGVLKRQQDPPPDLNGVFQTFETRRKLLPFRMTKVRMPRARCQNEVIVAELAVAHF